MGVTMGALKENFELDGNLDQIFCAESYSINQPFFQILQEGYSISSDDGRESFNAVRKRDFLKSIVGLIGACFGAMIIASSLFWGLKLFYGATSTKPEAIFIPAIAAAFGLVAGYLFFSKKFAPKRVTSLYFGDEEDTKKLIFQIMPSSGHFYFNREFSLIQNDQVRLTFKRPFINSLLRIKWEVYDENKKLLFCAFEDSWVMSILRRYFKLARLIPMHFIFKDEDEKVFCEFKRKFSIKDKYKIISQPSSHKAWMTLATCILLDTGEER